MFVRSRVAVCGLRRVPPPPRLGFKALGPAASLTLRRRCSGAGKGERLPGVRFPLDAGQAAAGSELVRRHRQPARWG